MELLTLVKQFLELINKKGGKERISYGTVNVLAEECFQHKYKRLEDKIKNIADKEELLDMIERIKKITNEKE